MMKSMDTESASAPERDMLRHRPRRVEDRWVYLVLCIVLTIFLIFGFAETYRTEGLFSYDPYYHMNLSQLLERDGEIVTELQFYERSMPPSYLTSMRLLTVLLHKYTGLDYMDIYKTFGLFCRVFTALALFFTAAYFLRDKRYALAAVILFLAAPYIFLRSLITYPENLVLPFQILIFGSIVKGLREKKADPALPLYVSAALYIHYRSFVVPALLLVLYLIFRKKVKYALALTGGVIVLSAPVLASAADQYLTYFRANVGPGAGWEPFATGAAYTVPTFNYYLLQLGVVLVLFTILGIPFLLHRIDAAKFILLAWLIFTFVLTRGKAVGLYIPTDRMMAYLSAPAAITSGLFLKSALEAEPLAPRLRTAACFLIALVLVFMLAVSVPKVRGWVGIDKDKRDAIAWVNDEVTQDDIVLPFRIDLVTTGIEMLSVIGSVEGGWGAILLAPEGIRAKLQAEFPQKDVFIVAGTRDFRVHDASVVFAQGDIRVYYYDNSKV